MGEDRGAARAKHQLYVQGRHLVAPVHLGRLLRSVIRAGAGLAVPPPAGALTLAAIPVVRPDGCVVLVDAGLNHDLRLIQSRLDRRGYRIVDASATAVEAASGVALLPDAAAAWQIDRSRLDAQLPRRAGDDDLAALDAPVAAVVVATATAPSTPGAAVAAAAALARDRSGALATRSVVDLTRLLDRAVVRPYVTTDPTPLTDLLA